MTIFHRMLSIAVCASLIATAMPANAQLQVEALVGRPFGVGRITVEDAQADADLVAMSNAYSLEERNGRVLYPVFTVGPLGRLLGRIFGTDGVGPGRSVSAYFLFVGDEPLELTFQTPAAHSMIARPQFESPRVYDRLLRRWWREYTRTADRQQDEGDYPPLVHAYLTIMLAQRLGLEAPLLERLRDGSDEDEVEQTLDLLLATESIRTETLERLMAGRALSSGHADRPLPRDIDWSLPASLDVEPTVAVEPLAMYVPQDCFYVRFGRFSNYLWMDKLLSEFGSDARTMITLRAHDAGVNNKIQQMLALRKSALADYLGEAVISDVALIGRDTFLREGPCVGMLFEARNNTVLGRDFQQQRVAAFELEKANGATLETIQIEGQDVSFLSTPDNRLRSFYAVNGNYHLITTSRAMMRSFLALDEGRGSLATLDEFRHARTLMPLDRADSVFVYFSSPFLRGLISPHYQIELQRRLRAVTEIELYQMAVLAARAEQMPAESIEDLVAGGFLPPGFGRRADGSQIVVRDGQFLDSRRGARGTFRPILDVPIEGVTSEEATWYAGRANYYQNNWQQMDPVMIAVHRGLPDDAGIERLSVEAYVSPFDETKYGWLTSVLAPPTTVQVQPLPQDLISVQAVLRGGTLRPGIPPHHVFLGVQDGGRAHLAMRPSGLLPTLNMLQSLPGYLGAWPKPGLLDMLPIRLGSEPDPRGFSTLPFGLWRRQWGDYSVLSFDRLLLEYLPRQIGFVDAERPAQIRVLIRDLTGTQLASTVDALIYERARRASIGNAKLLHLLSQQLDVPRAAALETAERLLDAEFLCPLGGEYELRRLPAGLDVWLSTAWPPVDDGRVPPDYHAHLLHWMRGFDAELTKYDDRVLVMAELDIQRQATESNGFELPFFSLFGSTAAPAADAAPEAAEVDANTPPPPPDQGREF